MGMWSEPMGEPGEMWWCSVLAVLFDIIMSGLPVPVAEKQVGKSGPRYCKCFRVISVCSCLPCSLLLVWCSVRCRVLMSARKYTGVLLLLKMLFRSV